MPSVIKLSHHCCDETNIAHNCSDHEHHHEEKHNKDISKNQLQFKELQLECDICSFNLHNFASNEIQYIALIYSQKINVFANFYNSFNLDLQSLFQLRAPPSLV